MTLSTALVSCTALGLQHGIDWDHVAAISDVTSVQTTPREATRCGLLYAAGHAATVGILGVAVMTLRHSLPGTVSIWMQRFVGLTLILLGVYVFGALFSGRRPLSRGQAILAIFERLHWGRRKELAGADRRYGRKSSLSLGVLHGIGAETPTQLSMLVIATNLGELQNGVLALTVFAAAMFVSNMALTTAATGVFTISKLRPALCRWLGILTAGYSLWIGIVLLTSS
jgi:high-affinity nickel permease